MKKLKLVIVNSKYCDYLRKFDKKVIYNFGVKENRPFIGVLFTVNDLDYFAPLTSPKPKHLKMKNTIDFYKIDGGKLGAINFNNMMPLVKNAYEVIKLYGENQNIDNIAYLKLLRDQYYWLNAHLIQIQHKSENLYRMYASGRLDSRITERCCNYRLLEEKCKEWKKS